MALALLAGSAGLSGCKDIPARASLEGWATGESRAIGPCEVRLLTIGYYHDLSWHLSVSVELSNTGSAEARCGWEAQLVSAASQPVTSSVGERRKLAPGQTVDSQRIANENDDTGFSHGTREGAWVLMTVTKGRPFIGDEARFHATPESVRPP